MIYLFLSIISSVAVANLLKFISKGKNISSLYVFLGNYFSASLLGLFFAQNTHMTLTGRDFFLSVSSGFFFLLGFIFYLENIKANGLSVSVSTFRLSLIVPVAGSMILFKEFLMPYNYLGIGIIFTSFILLGTQKGKYKLHLLSALFLIAGIADFFPRIFKGFGSASSESVYLMLNFFSAFIFNLLFILLKRESFSLPSLRFGFMLGIPNFLTAFFLLKSFDTLSGTIAYPVLSASIVVLTVATDFIIWKRRYSKKEYLIFALAAVGIIFTLIKL